MSLLITEIAENVNCVTESNEDGKKSYFIEGVIMQGDITNRNGRKYPVSVLKSETKRYNENYVSKNRAFGELGHPTGPTINMDRVSHMFTSLQNEGSNVVGRARISSTPMGQIVKGLIEDGSQLGVSSRGMGSVKKNTEGIMEVQEDFMLATAGDIVADPSAPNAFVKGIMEDVDWIYDIASSSWQPAKNTFDKIEEEVKSIAKVSSKQLEEQAVRLFTKFINSLTKTQ